MALAPARTARGLCHRQRGKQHKVHSFVDLAAGELAIYLTWRGQSVDEQGYDA